MHLGDDPDLPVLETFDNVELPKRPAPIERARCDVSHEIGQLNRPTGCGDARAAHVVIEVELGILDQRRVLESEGDLHHPHAERRHQRYPLVDQGADPSEAEPPGDIGGVEHHGAHDLQMGGG